MNVLFFSRLFYPHIGGVETHVRCLSEELIKRGHAVTIITEQHDIGLPFKQTYRKIVIYRIPVSSEKRKKYEIWKWLWKNRFLIQNADVVHAHDVGFWFFPFRLIYPSKKFYTTFHGYETVFPPRKKAVAMRKTTELLSNGVICIGEYIAKWYGTKPDIVMYGGVDKVKSLELKVKSLENRKIKILFVGRLDEDIGIKQYLETLKHLREKKIRYEVTFLGDGTYKKSALRYGKVFHYNNTYHYSELLNAADIIFASSYLSILESLSAQKAVFAVYTNPLKEDYLRLSPFAQCIFINNSSSRLVDQIIDYMHSPQKYNEQLKKAFQWTKKHTWEHVADQYETLWQK